MYSDWFSLRFLKPVLAPPMLKGEYESWGCLASLIELKRRRQGLRV